MDGSTNRTSASRLAGIVAGATLAIALTVIGTAAAAVPANTAPPTISGTAQGGSTLTASTGTWTGTGTITYSYAWQRCNAQGNGCGPIKGASASTYQLGNADVNRTIRVAVTASDSDGANTAVSGLTAAVTAAPLAPPPVKNPLAPKAGAPANTGLPTISGNVQEGATLTASTGTWNGNAPITFSYAWQRCDAAGAHCSAIGGSNLATYQVQKADTGKTLRVVVTAKNAAGSTSAASDRTGVVFASPAAAISLSASTVRAVYGTSVILIGTISTKQPGQTVTIEGQAFGAPGTISLGTVTTGNGGTWSFKTKPKIQTRYDARWNGATSTNVTVGVQPLVTFHLLTHKRFSTKVVAARSFAGKVVQFQRRSGAKWVTMKRIRLGGNSGAIFKAGLPKGSSSLRIAFSVNQAGAGYLGGTSRTITYPLHLT
jgi:hypothetical protein